MQRATDKAFSRRKFLQASGITGTAFFLGLYFPSSAKEGKIVGEAAATEVEMFAWVRIDTSGKVTMISHRAEMGQGAYQSIAQIIAEELEVDLKDVTIEFAQGDQKKYGSQITGGSSTIRGSYKNLLNLSASAREMLIEAAATKWGVAKTDCYAESGHVIHRPSGKKFHYGELVVDASKLQAPKNVTLKKPSEYKLIRKPLHRKDTPAKLNGSAIFGLDKRIPGMLFASVERNARFHGKVKSFDDSETRKIPGVKHVLKVRMGVHNTYREGVAVVADSYWTALQGRRALKIDWDDSGFDHLNSEQIYAKMKAALKGKDGLIYKKVGDPDKVIDAAKKKLDVEYETPYQYHACMEPLNCVANYQDDKLEIWGPIQAPDWVQDYISKEMNIPREKVIVNMTFLGGGFGRKAFVDYPHEAALISKEIKAPVQVIWSREDDMTQGPYRPGICYRCESVVTNGEVEAIRVRFAGQNIGHWSGDDKTKANWGTGEGFLSPYYETIKNISFLDMPFEVNIPPIWWRSVYASTNGFAYESFMDEVAREAGKDPLQFRRDNLKNERVLKLIDRLEEVSGWKNRKKNSGYGVAITECFESTVGQVVKVSKDANGKLKIDHVWAVMDCGWYVNPDIIKAQVEGSVIMALGAATMHEITFRDGMVEQKNFYAYNLPRINDTPPIDVFIMDNTADAGGVGEPGLPPFAPAFANAIYDLTGKRIRKLPFDMNSI